MNEFPMWAKLSASIGFPIAVAVWLMIYLSPLTSDTNAAVRQHATDTAIQTALLRAICRNTARSEMQASFCEFGLPQWVR